MIRPGGPIYVLAVVHKTNVYALVLNAKWTTINSSGSYVNEFRTFITLVQS